MNTKTLRITPEQIKNWRQIIFMRLEQQFPGAGSYAIIMPETEVIAYWRKMKAILEEPETEPHPEELSPFPEPKEIPYKKYKCNHSNSITGQNGTYCLDCESYI